MLVPAHNNDFGGFTKTDNESGWLQKATKISDGSITWSQGPTNLLRNQCWRSGKSSNPITYIKNVLPWRRNSGYYRKVVNCNWTEGGYSYTSGQYTYEVSGYRYAHSSIGTALSGPLSAGEQFWFTDARAQAQVESLLKLAEGKTNYGTFLAEAVTSANMVADRLGTLADLLLAVKHGRLGALKRAFGDIDSKTVANGLLEWQYGWKPLCQDLYNITESLKPRLKPPLMLEGSKTVTSHHVDRSDRRGAVDVWKERTQTTTGRNTCHLYARVSDAVLNKAQSIGLVNPLSLAWEVVPYSFVVDWAMPVGNVLSALTATAGLTFVGGYENEVREGHVETTIYRNGISYSSGKPERLDADVIVFLRNGLTGFPRPQFYGKSPFSTSHVSSALNLLRQLF